MDIPQPGALLRLADPAEIHRWQTQIEVLGTSINDPGIFIRAQQACLNRRAFLFLASAGFVVLEPVAGPGVNIWLAYSTSPIGWHKYIRQIELMSREIGAKFIEFGSDRKGYNRQAPKHGFLPQQSTWLGSPITTWKKYL